MTAPVTTPPLSLRVAPQVAPRPQSVRQVAIFLTSIGDENCANVLRHMSEEQVHLVSREITVLSSVTEDERRAVLERYTETIHSATMFHSGGLDYATSVLISAFGPETGKRMAERVSKSLEAEPSGFDSLQKADPIQLARIVQKEHRETPLGPARGGADRGGPPGSVARPDFAGSNQQDRQDSGGQAESAG